MIRWLEGKHGFLLTSNPDRLTRRTEELDDVLDLFTRNSVTWWSFVTLGRELGFPAVVYTTSQMSVGESNSKYPKVITLAPTTTIQSNNNTNKGRYQPLGTGFYQRTISQMTRILMYVERRKQALPSPDNGVDLVILYTRVSPDPDAGEKRKGDTQIMPSLERQITFMKTFIPHNISCEAYRDRYTSAASSASLKHVAELIGTQRDRV